MANRMKASRFFPRVAVAAAIFLASRVSDWERKRGGSEGGLARQMRFVVFRILP
jgi:hypothetical protein